MFLKVLLKGSLSPRTSKIHLLKHLFVPWTNCFHATKPYSSKILSSYFIYKFCHLLSCFSTENLGHATIWHDASYHSTCGMTFRSWFTSQYLKTKFWWIWFLPSYKEDSPSPLPSACKMETCRNTNLGKRGSTKLTCESKSTADINLPHSSMCFHQKIVMDSQAISNQRLLLQKCETI